MPWASLKADGPPDPASAGNISDNMQTLADSVLWADSMSHGSSRILNIC